MISLLTRLDFYKQEKPLHIRATALKIRAIVWLLQCFGYVTGANAAGTDLNGHDAAIFYSSDLLQVRIPYGTSFVVGVAYIVAEAGPFSTNITFS